ncbi:unnamed protein product [Closterium sp. NIES-53]
MACTRGLQQQVQPQHSRQWGPAGPKCGAPNSGSARSGQDVGPCGYRALTGPGVGTTCWSPYQSASSCYRRLDDLHRQRFGPHAITPHWPSRLRQRTAAPVESHLPGLGPSPAARVETCVSSLGLFVVSILGTSESLCVGAATTTNLAPAFITGSGVTSQTAQLSFTLDSRASSCFFRDCTDLTPLRTQVPVALADPSVGPVVAHNTTTLLCPAAPSRFLTGYYSPSFSRNLVGVSHLHDLSVVSTFPVDVHVASCTVGATGALLATFHREPGSGLYSLDTGSHHTKSGLVRLGLPQSLALLPRSHAPPCTPCIEGRQCAASHSSFSPTTAPFQTLHLDVWGPSPVLGPCHECYFLIVVDDYFRYTTVFPLRRKVDIPTVLKPRLLARGGTQGLCGLRLYLDCGVCYAAHQLNLWPSDARPRVTPVFLWTGSLGVAADFRVWGCLAHVRAPGANNLSPRTRACIFPGFPMAASGWVFYDPPPLVALIAPPSSRPALSGVSHVTPQSSPPQHPVPVVSGGTGGAVAEGEGTGAAGAGGVGSGGAGGVCKVHLTPLAVDHGLTTPLSDESFKSSGPYPEQVGCLIPVIA